MSTDTIILIVRILITLTFLLLAVGGPYALLKLNRFIRLYLVRHSELEERIAALERMVQRSKAEGE